MRAHPEREREDAAEERAGNDQVVVPELVGEVGREQPSGYTGGVENGEDVERGRGGEAMSRGIVDDVEIGYKETFLAESENDRTVGGVEGPTEGDEEAGDDD